MVPQFYLNFAVFMSLQSQRKQFFNDDMVIVWRRKKIAKKSLKNLFINMFSPWILSSNEFKSWKNSVKLLLYYCLFKLEVIKLNKKYYINMMYILQYSPWQWLRWDWLYNVSVTTEFLFCKYFCKLIRSENNEKNKGLYIGTLCL